MGFGAASKHDPAMAAYRQTQSKAGSYSLCQRASKPMCKGSIALPTSPEACFGHQKQGSCPQALQPSHQSCAAEAPGRSSGVTSSSCHWVILGVSPALLPCLKDRWDRIYSSVNTPHGTGPHTGNSPFGPLSCLAHSTHCVTPSLKITKFPQFHF